MQNLGVTCASETATGGINDRGDVASSSQDLGGFLWTLAGGFQVLSPLSSTPVGVNNLDQVTGTYPIDQRGLDLHAFIWAPGEPAVQDLGTLGGSDSYAVDINNSGQVVGWSYITDWVSAAFLWTENAGMQVLGPSDFGASAINDQGQVAGGLSDGHAALWTQAGGVQDLGTLPGTTNSSAYGINNRGVVVGNSRNANYGFVFLWSPAQGMLNVNTLCKNPQQNWTAVGINDAGQIVVDKKGGQVLILTPIIGLAVSSSQNPSELGQLVTLTATATSIAGAPPDGETVTFLDSTTLLGTAPLVAGQANFSTAGLAVGTHRISATYPGDVNYASSSSKVLKQVVK